MATRQLSLAAVADAGALSGALWLGTEALTKLQQRLLSKLACFVDLLAASTRLDIDLGNSSTIVCLVAFPPQELARRPHCARARQDGRTLEQG